MDFTPAFWTSAGSHLRGTCLVGNALLAKENMFIVKANLSTSHQCQDQAPCGELQGDRLVAPWAASNDICSLTAWKMLRQPTNSTGRHEPGKWTPNRGPPEPLCFRNLSKVGPSISLKSSTIGCVWKCCVPLNPMVNDHYPYENWLAIIGNINPTFSGPNMSKPIWDHWDLCCAFCPTIRAEKKNSTSIQVLCQALLGVLRHDLALAAGLWVVRRPLLGLWPPQVLALSLSLSLSKKPQKKKERKGLQGPLSSHFEIQHHSTSTFQPPAHSFLPSSFDLSNCKSIGLDRLDIHKPLGFTSDNSERSCETLDRYPPHSKIGTSAIRICFHWQYLPCGQSSGFQPVSFLATWSKIVSAAFAEFISGTSKHLKRSQK